MGWTVMVAEPPMLQHHSKQYVASVVVGPCIVLQNTVDLIFSNAEEILVLELSTASLFHIIHLSPHSTSLLCQATLDEVLDTWIVSFFYSSNSSFSHFIALFNLALSCGDRVNCHRFLNFLFSLIFIRFLSNELFPAFLSNVDSYSVFCIA